MFLTDLWRLYPPSHRIIKSAPYIYIYIYVSVFMYVCIYIYIVPISQRMQFLYKDKSVYDVRKNIRWLLWQSYHPYVYNTLCQLYTKVFDVIRSGTYRNHLALKGWTQQGTCTNLVAAGQYFWRKSVRNLLSNFRNSRWVKLPQYILRISHVKAR